MMSNQAERENRPFEGLPPGARKDTIVKLVKEVGPRHGWTASLMYHLEFLISRTAARDWRPGGRPMVCLSVQETALELGISNSQVRRNENQMRQLGALVFRDSPNYSRYTELTADGVIVAAFGLDLSPIATLIPNLTILAEAHEREYAERLRLQRAISAARRSILSALDYASQQRLISNETEAEMRVKIPSLTVRPTHNTPLDVIQRRLASLQELDHDLSGLITGSGTDSSDIGGTSHG